ncbi:MAG: FkbM family methyltransferase [Chitinophagaceae bacterium]|nr:FkbM family methyltransferase [Chitinophagaceae bacterium]
MLKEILFKLFKPSLIANSHSQAGEDRIIDFLFSTMGIKKISYIDIGTNDPKFCNNTYLFYCKGGRGILIEPDPVFKKLLQRSRPKDKVIEAAISDKENGEADFFIFDEPSINTLSKEEATLRQKSGKYTLKEIKRIPLVTIENVIATYLNGNTPHLISLDVEGVDLSVLKAFDYSRYPVPVWIVETCEYSENHIKPKITPIVELMQSKGYFIYGDTYVNTIFVNKEWFYKDFQTN